MTPRASAIAVILSRAAGRRVFGFGSQRASCAELGSEKAKCVPDEWTHMAVEGDERWVEISGGDVDEQ